MKTLILGASTNPERYAYLAAKSLTKHKHEIVLVGRDIGEVAGISIQQEFPLKEENIHTVTIYLSPKNQVLYYEMIKNLNPKRVIFNPGAENKELQSILDENSIAWENSCTLTLLSLNIY